jgi:hypothetical protein
VSCTKDVPPRACAPHHSHPPPLTAHQQHPRILRPISMRTASRHGQSGRRFFPPSTAHSSPPNRQFHKPTFFRPLRLRRWYRWRHGRGVKCSESFHRPKNRPERGSLFCLEAFGGSPVRGSLPTPGPAPGGPRRVAQPSGNVDTTYL